MARNAASTRPGAASQAAPAAPASTRSSTTRARQLDYVYAAFLALHLFPALLLDSQSILPAFLFPDGLKRFLANYIASSGDPVVGNIAKAEFAWLRAYMYCEVFLQSMVFIIGPIALFRNDKRAWPMLLLYASHGATTTLGCLANVLAAKGLTSLQFQNLLYAYIPYLLVPLVMAVDMTIRLTREVGGTGIKAKLQ